MKGIGHTNYILTIYNLFKLILYVIKVSSRDVLELFGLEFSLRRRNMRIFSSLIHLFYAPVVAGEVFLTFRVRNRERKRGNDCLA